MKIIDKTRSIIIDNSGESMVEVLVAFTLLSIMLVIFSEGIAWATKTEVNASNARRSADDSMLKLQKSIATGVNQTGVSRDSGTDITVGDGCITRYTYTVDGNTYVVYEEVPVN